MGIRFIGTLANRLLTALLNFLIVVITARYLGPEGRGEISLLILAVSMIQMVAGIMGGGAIVYLAPRYQQLKIILISSSWALITASVCSYAMIVLHLIQGAWLFSLFLLSLLVSLFANMQSLLLARQNFLGFNLTSVLQPLTLLIVFYLMVDNQQEVDITHYIRAAYLGYGIPLVATLFFFKRAPAIHSTWKEIIQKFLNHGAWSQLANLAQLLNYRFSYYLIEWARGTAQLGIFSTGISVSESVWVFSKSLSTVKYAQSANESDLNKLHAQALLLIKFSAGGTLVLVGALCFIPDNVYLFIFGNSFKGIQHLMIHLSPGVLFLSVYTILAAYFSGTGRHHLSSKASLLGLAVTIPGCWLLIPTFGVTGAAWAANLSHAANGSFLLYFFTRELKMKLTAFFPAKGDLGKFRKMMKYF